ncbi:MAG: rod shape-determining protein MreC [Sediminispirochaetaceae bacterium]
MDGVKGFLSRYRNIITLIALLSFSLTALATQSLSVSTATRRVGYSVLSSFQHGFARIGMFFGDAFSSIGELKEIRSEYEVLQEKLVEYRSMERKLIDMRRENEQLRELIGFSEEIEFAHVPARIIAKEPGSLFSGFTINKGLNEGVREDTSVIAYSEGFTCLVGKVMEVTSHNAKVLPMTDHSSYVAARMMESRYEGLVNGKGTVAGLVKMEYVKKQAKDEIEFGDLVITSGLRSIYPENIYIGRVVEINAPEWETSLTLEIRPLVDFTKLEYVFVLVEDDLDEENS